MANREVILLRILRKMLNIKVRVVSVGFMTARAGRRK
jgi:hypothetical protein